MAAKERGIGPASLSVAGNVLLKNWPAFYPIAVHRISLEVPQEGQHLIRKSYLLWKSTFPNPNPLLVN